MVMFENGGYWWWEGVLPNEMCNLIIAEGDKLVSDDGRIGGNNTPGQVNHHIRDTNISFFPSGHWVEGLCVHYAMLANKDAGWNFNINNAQPVQYARYFPDQHYKPHRDDYVRPSASQTMRKLSVSIQITHPDNYTNGNFVIEQENGSLQPLTKFRTRGSIIVFPSLMMHGVEPVGEGVRHSIVCWIEGPNFK